MNTVQAQVDRETPGWFEFVVPGLDSSETPVDMSSLNPDPAGSRGFIGIDDAHFVDGTGARIRFLGTNLTFASTFPDKEIAPKVAAHMRKLGLNIVRFHHMDNQTAPGGIWLKDQQGFDPDQLDKLDWMIYQLKQHGIYTNLNLHVSRNYPELGSVSRSFVYGKVLDHFYRPFIEMQKEYARSLLLHRNPYTGTTYIKEPAVAFVEINNENTLIQNWRSLLEMPEPFQSVLMEQWHAWLKQHYRDTQTLREAWQIVREPMGDELLRNGDLLHGTESWVLERGTTADGRLDVSVDGPDGGKALHVTTFQPGEQDWNLQVHQLDLDLQDGVPYTVHFRAKSDGERRIQIGTRLQDDPWSFVGLQTEIKLGTEWREYTFVLQARQPAPTANRLSFNLHNQIGEFWFSDLSLQRGGNIGLPEGQSLEEGTITFPPVDAPEPIRHSFWAFLVDTEMAYSREMVRFLKDTLGVRSHVSVTQASYGGMAGVFREATLSDYVDMHSYWQHPRFPNRPWSSTDWNIQNTSMVNDADGGTLTRLAFHRVMGMPFTVSEYDHPAPSDYAAELFPMLASFAAFQDWDALYQFDYRGRDWDQRRISGFFALNGHPGKLVFVPIAAVMFRMAGVSACEGLSLLTMSPDDVVDELTRHGTNVRGTWREAVAATAFEARTEHGLEPDPLSWLPIRIAVAVDTDAHGFERPTHISGASWMREPWQSVTNEIVWDRRTPEQGLYTVNADQAKAVVGYLGGRSVQLGDVAVEMPVTATNWASIAMAALDGKPIRESSRVLLAAVGRVENGQMGWNADRTSVSNQWGTEPTVAEGIPATITLTQTQDVQVHVLDGTGAPKEPVRLETTAGSVRFHIGPEYETLWYLISRP